MKDYVRTDLPRIAGEAVRKFGPGAVAVPDVRPAKDERLLFPGYNSSTFGRLVKRVSGSNVNVNKLRSLMETEMDRLLKSYVSTKRTRTKRTTDNKEQSDDEESSVA